MRTAEKRNRIEENHPKWGTSDNLLLQEGSTGVDLHQEQEPTANKVVESLFVHSIKEASSAYCCDPKKGL